MKNLNSKQCFIIIILVLVLAVALAGMSIKGKESKMGTNKDPIGYVMMNHGINSEAVEINAYYTNNGIIRCDLTDGRTIIANNVTVVLYNDNDREKPATS